MNTKICSKEISMNSFRITLLSGLMIAFSNVAFAEDFGIAAPSNSVRLFGYDFASVDDDAFILWGARWQQSKIPVCWENPEDASEGDLEAVKTAVKGSWEKNSCLEFTGWKKCAPNNMGIRVLIDDDGPHAKGLGATLDGKRNGIVLNFSYQTWGQTCLKSEKQRQLCNTSIAVHEWGHALAFSHEHNRWDTPAECLKAPQGTNGDLALTSWDPDSVMNYCNPVYANDGVLSDGDINGLHKAYCAPHEGVQ